ncbi:hypothetical protein [Kineococcus sp. NPDC059986]|uniref:hypothetical protein n=1 Tax=Kineococcus sp. NPDC059986 TaxID=3155538 RepID=UPI0034509297
MSHEADTVAERPTGAQTVAPIQASALLFAASILGEGSYTPEQELKGTLNAGARTETPEVPAPAAPVAQPVAQPAPQPVAEPVAQPAPRPEPQPVRAVVPPARVEPAPAPQPVERKGFFARLLDKLLGRG